MRTVDYDALAASAPLNRAAAVARDGRGISYASKLALPEGYVHSELPLPLRPIPEGTLRSSTFTNLTGRTIGRLKVLGLYSVVGGDKASWVVRCSCGAYEVRKGRGLATATEIQAATFMCLACTQTERLKRDAAKIAAGKGRPAEWVMEDRRRQAAFDHAQKAIVRAARAFVDGADGGENALRAACEVYEELVRSQGARKAAA